MVWLLRIVLRRDYDGRPDDVGVRPEAADADLCMSCASASGRLTATPSSRDALIPGIEPPADPIAGGRFAGNGSLRQRPRRRFWQAG
jgi:hypothetical protein